MWANNVPQKLNKADLSHVSSYRTGGKFRAIPDFALFRQFRGY